MSYADPFLNPNSPEYRAWEANNARLPGAAGMPEWQQYGFPNEESYFAVYPDRRPGAGGTSVLAPPPGPLPPPNPPPALKTNDPSDPFGSYLTNNPGARDNWSYLRAILDDAGLGSLYDFAKEQVIEGRSGIEVIQRLRERPEYKTRFQGNEVLKKAGRTPLDERQYLDWERTARRILQQAQFPAQFYDSPDDFSKFIGNEWDPQEFEDWVMEGYVKVSQESAEVKAELQRLYGMKPGDMAAFMLDETRALPLLKRQIAAGQISGSSVRSGYGQLALTEAEDLAAAGVTQAQATQGFGELGTQRELFSGLPGQSEEDIDRAAQLQGTFNNNAAAKERIARRAAKRKATFAGSTAYAGDKSGLTGLGANQS